MRTISTYVNVLRNGVKITTLTKISTPTIRMDSNSMINSSLSGTFKHDDGFEWLTDELEPIIEIDGIPKKCGIFIPTTVNISTTDGIKTIDIEAYDRCWLVYSTTTDRIVHFDSGENYVDTITSLLAQCGISKIISKPSDFVFSSDREDWEFGTDYLTIVNALLDEINYKPLWFNSEGYAVLEPEPLTQSENVARTYNHDNIMDLVVDRSNLEVDLFESPNVFVCICQNPDKSEPLISTAINDNPASPLSTVRRGREIMKSYKIDNIPNQDALNDYARLICLENMLIGEKGEITTLIIPNVGVDDIVAVVYPGMDGLYKEIAYEMQLDSGGTMIHHLERLVGEIGT